VPFDASITIAGLGGESPADAIEVLSFHWGVSQLGSRGGTAGGAGQAHVQDFSFVKRADAASPLLFLRCCTGERLAEAVFLVRRESGERRECLRYTFHDVRVASVRPGGSSQAADDFPAEEISLSFARCEVDHWLETADGTAIGEPVHGEWET
jgi:type VI secretion system secreted protein Hcp